MIKIGFLALAQAHQHFHWLPAALELASRPGVSVDVLCPSRAGLKLIRSFDPDRRLNLVWLPAQFHDGLFDLPSRKRVHILYRPLFRRYPLLVTTESTSARLRQDPKFRSALIRIRHGVGDAATRVDDSRLNQFDLSLVGGVKDKQRLIAAGLATDENCIVTGYAKFELIRPPPPLFADDRPIALYNPHCRRDLSSWFLAGEALLREMERLDTWHFIVAPHVKLKAGPDLQSDAPNILIDRGSIRSIDMTYTQAASVYIGDGSSQVYEFLARPRPCIFVNAQRVAWQGNEQYAHFALGQVIERPEEIGPALAQAERLQAQFEPLQRAAIADSIDDSTVPASRRQADAILQFIYPRTRNLERVDHGDRNPGGKPILGRKARGKLLAGVNSALDKDGVIALSRGPKHVGHQGIADRQYRLLGRVACQAQRMLVDTGIGLSVPGDRSAHRRIGVGQRAGT